MATPTRHPRPISLHPLAALASIGCCLVVLFGCTQAVYGPQVHRPDELATVHASPLKVHLLSGDLLVLSQWHEEGSRLEGTGFRYSPQRRQLPQYRFSVPLDSVALLESEVLEGNRPSAIGTMAVWSVMWGITTISCMADPKSCFGSCPTFYVDTEDGPVLAAEGFSSSILRVLEEEDLDALYPAESTGGEFTLLMRNEAWETHAVRSVRLVANRREPGRRVLADGTGSMYSVGRTREAVSCRAAEGDCRPDLARPDGNERYSLADSTDLAATETIELAFEPGTGEQGLVLALRHSLLSTYLFYETLGFLGRRAGEFWADLERGGTAAARQALAMEDRIGRIEIEARDGDRWVPVGIHDEAGPLATQFVVVPIKGIPEGDGPVRIRLTATRGAWRFDWAALADIRPADPPLELEPARVARDGADDRAALDLLRAPDRHLVTYPGDDYAITFSLPPSTSGWDLHVRTTGYYYEWMRSEWLDDEDLYMAAMVRYNPEAALRVLAPAYKAAEPHMEGLFWSSRFGRKP